MRGLYIPLHVSVLQGCTLNMTTQAVCQMGNNVATLQNQDDISYFPSTNFGCFLNIKTKQKNPNKTVDIIRL